MKRRFEKEELEKALESTEVDGTWDLEETGKLVAKYRLFPKYVVYCVRQGLTGKQLQVALSLASNGISGIKDKNNQKEMWKQLKKLGVSAEDNAVISQYV